MVCIHGALPMGNLCRPTQSQFAPLKAWGFPFHLLKKAYFFKLRRQKSSNQV